MTKRYHCPVFGFIGSIIIFSPDGDLSMFRACHFHSILPHSIVASRQSFDNTCAVYPALSVHIFWERLLDLMIPSSLCSIACCCSDSADETSDMIPSSSSRICCIIERVIFSCHRVVLLLRASCTLWYIWSVVDEWSCTTLSIAVCSQCLTIERGIYSLIWLITYHQIWFVVILSDSCFHNTSYNSDLVVGREKFHCEAVVYLSHSCNLKAEFIAEFEKINNIKDMIIIYNKNVKCKILLFISSWNWHILYVMYI